MAEEEFPVAGRGADGDQITMQSTPKQLARRNYGFSINGSAEGMTYDEETKLVQYLQGVVLEIIKLGWTGSASLNFSGQLADAPDLAVDRADPPLNLGQR